MRLPTFRIALIALATISAGAGNALIACSGGQSSTGGEGDASAPEGSTPGSPDAGDATLADAGDSSLASGDSSLPDGGDASALDAGIDAPSDGGPADAPSGFGIDGGDCGIGPKGEPTDLACTGLYSDWPSKTVASDLKTYDPGLAFWSDGAQKTRWISLPPGQKIDTSDMDEWTFPVGTRIWKEFRLRIGDAAVETRIETRLLWKLAPGMWYRTTYRWSDDGVSSATELTNGQLDAGGTGYEVPSQVKCNTCHNGRKDGVLGVEAVSLSSPGASGLTMGTLLDAGLLSTAPDASLAVPGDAVASAALGWLHSNCGTACHNGGNGQARGSGLWMRLDVATLASEQTTNAYTTGWNQQTLGFPIPDAAVSYRLHACDVASSCVYFRAGHRNGVGGTPNGTQMPPVDTHVVDVVDLAKIAAWIDEGCDGGDGG